MQARCSDCAEIDDEAVRVAGETTHEVSVAHVSSLAAIVHHVRSDAATTRPELSRLTNLGRNVVALRVGELMELGLLEDDGPGTSIGGRPARSLTFRADAGRVLIASLGHSAMTLGIADLAGHFIDKRHVVHDITTGPESAIAVAESVLDDLVADHRGEAIWGVGVGVPGPVEFATGRPVAPPIMPGWDNYPVRDRLANRYGAPAWLDNDVNLMALGELRTGTAQGVSDAIFVKVGTGIGAGLICNGRLWRGAQGAAGEIGHSGPSSPFSLGSARCQCGNVGCLVATSSGHALGTQAVDAARDGSSRWLAEAAERGAPLTDRTVTEGARHGDAVCVEMLVTAAQRLGDVLATVVNFYNPSLIVIGGRVAEADERFLTSVRQVIYSRAMPLNTRNLVIVKTTVGEDVAAIGAVHMVLDELFSQSILAQWLPFGSPTGRQGLSQASGT